MLFSGSEFRRGKGVTSCGGTKKLAAGHAGNPNHFSPVGTFDTTPLLAPGRDTLQLNQIRGPAQNVTWLRFRSAAGRVFFGAGHAATERPLFGRFPSCPATFAEKSTIARPRLKAQKSDPDHRRRGAPSYSYLLKSSERLRTEQSRLVWRCQATQTKKGKSHVLSYRYFLRSYRYRNFVLYDRRLSGHLRSLWRRFRLRSLWRRFRLRSLWRRSHRASQHDEVLQSDFCSKYPAYLSNGREHESCKRFRSSA